MVVEPVRVLPHLAAVWQLVARKITRKSNKADFTSRLAVWKFADMIISFSGGGVKSESENEGERAAQKQESAGIFQVAVKDLATTTPSAHGCPLGAGDVATLRTLRLRKKLVRIVALKTGWDTRAIAASLQHEARFAKPAYYINVMFALVVRFGNTSAPCERWAHELKLLWDPQRTQPTSSLIHRLHGRVAGLRGDGTD